MVADVSADADPQTDPAVYGTTDGLAGWNIVGGTSASSPYIAGVIEGQNCGGDYQCNAVTGYDGPTGLGTPDGVAAFQQAPTRLDVSDREDPPW